MSSNGGISLWVSDTLRANAPLWDALQQALHGRVNVVERPSIGEPSACIAVGNPLQWGCLQSDFHYLPHQQLCLEGAAATIASPGTLGTRLPLVVLFVDAADSRNAEAIAGPFVQQLRAPQNPFQQSRVLLLRIGKKSSALKPSVAASFATCLVAHSVGTVELQNAEEAAEYLVQCSASIAESRKRRVPSRFKVAGTRCQTLPSGAEDKLRIAWVSQLMQIPGVSEEIAKVVAERYSSPAVMLRAVEEADRSSTGDLATSSRLAECFLAELEYPIRGKKSMRRVGPVISRRIFTLFHASVSPQHLLS